MEFPYRWLIWLIVIAFAAVAILSLSWPALFNVSDDRLTKKMQQILLWSIPLAFIMSSQLCVLGLKGCNAACSIINISLIGIAG